MLIRMRIVPRLINWIEQMPVIASMMLSVSLIGRVNSEAVWIKTSVSTLMMAMMIGTPRVMICTMLYSLNHSRQCVLSGFPSSNSVRARLL